MVVALVLVERGGGVAGATVERGRGADAIFKRLKFWWHFIFLIEMLSVDLIIPNVIWNMTDI